MDMARKYELKQRAETMEETRQRITDAAMHLHGSVGPARTTVTAVAERAGVQRHTVYRHFPTEAELFASCSGHFAALHPWPDTDAWSRIDDPRERLASGLDELYRWYEETGEMWTRILRDRELVEALEPALQPFYDYVDRCAGTLSAGWASAVAAGASSKPRSATRSSSRPGIAGGEGRDRAVRGREPDDRARHGQRLLADR